MDSDDSANDHSVNDSGYRAADWADRNALIWLRYADQLEAQLEPVLEPLLRRAALTPGERVLDVGCGRGASTLLAARHVGPTGHVVGADISPALINAAAQLPTDDGSAPIDWVCADVQSHQFPVAGFDTAISRFGVMFFDDPVAAFANIRAAVRPGGRLTMAVWQPIDRSSFFTVMTDAAFAATAELGIELPANPPNLGPFTMGEAAYTFEMLRAAGWDDAHFDPMTLTLYSGGAGTTPELATEVAMAIGPQRVLLEGHGDHVIDAVAAAIEAALASHWDGTGIALQGAIALVTATNSVGA
jgi:SAM-dependent methyltransferase